MPCTYRKTHRHACTCSHTIIYTCRCTLIYAHTEGPQCSGHLQYWTQTQACTLYLHENGLQQSAAPLVCFVPPAVWAWGRELLVRWGGPHQMGSHVYGAKRCEEREKEGGKRLPAWQPPKQQGLPHTMEVVHGLGSIFDWRAEGRQEPSKRPSCLWVQPQQERFKTRAHSSFQNRWGQSGLREDGWEPGLLLVGRGVIFDKCICGCGGVGVNDKKLRTAVSIHIQVTWRKDGACLYLFLVIVCRVFACPSVLAGQTWWRSRHMDQTFCPRACFKVHLMVGDLDRTHQLRQAGSVPSVNGLGFESWHFLSHWGNSKIVTFTSFTCTIVHNQKWNNCMAMSFSLGWQTCKLHLVTESECSATSWFSSKREQMLSLVIGKYQCQCQRQCLTGAVRLFKLAFFGETQDMRGM